MRLDERVVEDAIIAILAASFPWFAGVIDGVDYDFDRGSWIVALMVDSERRIALIPEEALEDDNRRAVAAILRKIIGNPPQEERIGFRRC